MMRNPLGDTADEISRRRYAYQDKVLALAAKNYPGVMSIKDYTYGEGRLVYMNESLLEYEGLTDVDYYGKLPSEVLIDGEKFCAEDRLVLEGEKAISFSNNDRYGRHWVKQKYKVMDGDKVYVVATLIPVTDEVVNLFQRIAR